MLLRNNPDFTVEAKKIEVDECLSNLNNFSFVGLLESFQSDCIRLQAVIPGLKLRERRKNISIKKVTAEEMRPDQILKIQQLNRLDQQLYDRVVKSRREPPMIPTYRLRAR